MKNLICCCFLFLFCALSSQNKIIWKATPKKLPKLKQEAYLKLDFELDSFTVLDVMNDMPEKKSWRLDTLLKSNAEYFAGKSPVLKDSYKAAFEKGFSASLEDKLIVQSSLSKSAYNYSVRITPVRYYIYCNQAGRGVNNSSFMYYYLRGDYRIAIFKNESTQPVGYILFNNQFNEKPMCAPYAEAGRYSNDPSVEIGKNMFLAGKEAGKRFLKLIGIN